MNKKHTSGIALIAAAIIISLAACVPPMDAGLEKVQKEGKTQTGTVLQVQFVNPDGTPYSPGGGVARSVAGGGISRSITAEQENALINYYEIITRIQDKSDGAGGIDLTAVPTDDQRYNRVAAAKTQGWASVPVEEDYRYQVLLLEGWKDAAGGDPVLLRSAYGVSDFIVKGVNTVTLTVQNLLVTPDDASDAESGYRFYIQGEDNNTPLRPAYDGSNGNVMTAWLPVYATGLNPIPAIPGPGPRMTIAIEGAIPLMLARDFADTTAGGAVTAADIAEYKLASTAANGFFDREGDSYPVQITRGINIPQTSADNQQISAEWKRQLTTDTINSGTVGGGKAGRILLTVDIPDGADTGSLSGFLMGQNGNGSLFFDARYYGYSLADAKTKGFTRWAVRNGLNYLYYDREANAYGNYTGGALAIKFGSGGGSVSTTDQATVLEVQTGTQLLTRAATISLSSGTNDRISYVITASHPVGTYKLYWSDSALPGVIPEALPSGIKEIDIPRSLTGSVTSNGDITISAGNTYYFRVITTLGNTVVEYDASIEAGSPIIELGFLDAAPAIGLGWQYDETTHTVTVADGAKVTLTGSTSTVKVVTAGNATITMDNASINFSGTTVPLRAMSLGGAVILKLKSGTVNTIIGLGKGPVSTQGGVGIEVPTSASLDIQGPGRLTVTVDTSGGSAPGGPGIGFIGGSAGNITISGGTIKVDGNRAPAIGVIGSGVDNNGSITIQGGVVSLGGGVTGNFHVSLLGVANGGNQLGDITIKENAVVNAVVNGGLVKVFGAGTNAAPATSGEFHLQDNAVIMVNSGISADNRVFNLADDKIHLTSGVARYGNMAGPAWQVYGSPVLQGCNLVIPANQEMHFYPGTLTGLDANGVPQATLSSTSSASQTLKVGSGATLTNSGAIVFHGASPIGREMNGQYINNGTERQN